MSEPEISIVIPVYNRAKLLAAALGSVAAQTFKDIEIIVVDDGSTDDVNATLNDFDHLPVTLVRHAQNKGAAAARNTGIQTARGNFIAFLDSDDVWLPNKLEVQLEDLKSQDESTKANCTAYIVASNDHRRKTIVRTNPPQNWHQYILLGCNLSIGTTLLVERSCFSELGFFDASMRRFEDWDWMLRYTSRYNLTVVDEPLAVIIPGAPPPQRDVLDSLKLLREKHLPAISAMGSGKKHRFMSALSLEESASWYRESHFFKAASFLAISYFQFPFRRLSFYSNAVQKAAKLAYAKIR